MGEKVEFRFACMEFNMSNPGDVQNRWAVHICSLRIKVKAEAIHLGIISTKVIIRKEI